MLHFIKLQIFIYCFSFHITCLAQTNTELKYNEGGAPKAHFFLLQGDSLIPLVHLHRSEVNVVVVRVEGGMDNVLYNQVLSSRDALVEKSKAIYADLKKKFGRVIFDDNGKIVGSLNEYI